MLNISSMAYFLDTILTCKRAKYGSIFLVTIYPIDYQGGFAIPTLLSSVMLPKFVLLSNFTKDLQTYEVDKIQK